MTATLSQVAAELRRKNEDKHNQLVENYVAVRKKHDPTATGLTDLQLVTDAMDRPADELRGAIEAADEIESAQANIVPREKIAELRKTASTAFRKLNDETVQWEARKLELSEAANLASYEANATRIASHDAAARIAELKSDYPAAFGVSLKVAPEPLAPMSVGPVIGAPRPVIVPSPESNSYSAPERLVHPPIYHETLDEGLT